MRLTLATHLSPWHYSGFWVAEVATGLAAALFSARAVDVYPTATIAIRDTLKDLGLSQAERALFWRRGAYLLTCPTRPDDHSLTIENSATVATCRGRGYTSALLARAFDEGRSSGLAEAQISCFIGNHAAERAYEKAGFIRFRERRHPVFEATAGSPGMQQFMKAL
jgi:GNAT superfamily N-acetyltransferase